LDEAASREIEGRELLSIDLAVLAAPWRHLPAGLQIEWRGRAIRLPCGRSQPPSAQRGLSGVARMSAPFHSFPTAERL